MVIPDEIRDRLEYQANRSIQQEDIVQVMDENQTDKPWSRYMIQQSLGVETTRATVNNRLQELVELDVLEKYEYRGNTALYDLAYDPIVTDGGRLQSASLLELATFRDRDALKELILAGSLYSLIFLMLGALAGTVATIPAPVHADSLFVTIALTLILTTFVLLALLKIVERVEPWLRSSVSLVRAGDS